eukprot:scaffold92730_cov21-Tisochrysis_lutea.AAC.1
MGPLEGKEAAGGQVAGKSRPSPTGSCAQVSSKSKSVSCAGVLKHVRVSLAVLKPFSLEELSITSLLDCCPSHTA